MKSNIFIFTVITISSLILFGCDQILDRSLGKISEKKNNKSTLANKESPLKSLDASVKENSIKKPKEGKKIAEEDLSTDNSKEVKKKYDVIGTNKDGPYRSGETNRIRSTK